MNTIQEPNMTRVDFFAAHALQGLLANGQFTEETEDGGWVKLIQVDEFDENGNETGRKKTHCPLIELAWRLADMMERDREEMLW